MIQYPEIIIFDLDNTLVQSRIDFVKLRNALTHFVQENDLLNGRQFHNMPISKILAAIEDSSGLESTASRQAWEIVEEYENEGMIKATVSDDVVPSLVRIRKLGIKTAVFTNNSNNSAAPVLDKFQLGPFDIVKTRDNVKAMKPSGFGLLDIVQVLSGSLERTYFVGDSYVDGLCAQDAGIKFIAFGADIRSIEERGIPYYAIVKDMKQLAEFVELRLPKVADLL